MNRRHIYYFILLLLLGISVYGCSSSGSSSVEPINDPAMSDVTDSVTLTGSKQGQSGGFADVDGDGIADKIVGAPYASTSSSTGAVLVYKGDSSGGYSSSPTTLVTGDGEDNMGFSFVRLEKGSNDAAERFAVGAINGSGDGSDDASLCGTVSVYEAGSSGPELAVELSGDGPMDKFGYALASGDLNGDGSTDLIVGAPFNTNDPSLYQSGAVYVYFGPDFDEGSRVAIYPDPNDSSTRKSLGWAVAAGNVNNDAVSDLVISASGKVLVYLGGSAFNPALNSPDMEFTSSSGGFGRTIAVVGDLDGDGYGEIAVGAPTATITVDSISNRDTGSVYMVKGTASGSVSVDESSDYLIVRIDGSALFDRFGASVVAAGDADNDGTPDFAVGSTMADADANHLSGKVYFFSGEDVSSATTLSNATVFDGNAIDQAYGTFLASNGSGKLLIGAPRSNMDTGGVSMVDLESGEVVSEESSGGSSGDSGDCH